MYTFHITIYVKSYKDEEEKKRRICNSNTKNSVNLSSAHIHSKRLLKASVPYQNNCITLKRQHKEKDAQVSS